MRHAEVLLHADAEGDVVSDAVAVTLREPAGERDGVAEAALVGETLEHTDARGGVALLEAVEREDADAEREALGEAVLDTLPLGEAVADAERVTRRGVAEGVVDARRDGEVVADVESDEGSDAVGESVAQALELVLNDGDTLALEEALVLRVCEGERVTVGVVHARKPQVELLARGRISGPRSGVHDALQLLPRARERGVAHDERALDPDLDST
jgi:hypothetical protein